MAMKTRGDTTKKCLRVIEKLQEGKDQSYKGVAHAAKVSMGYVSVAKQRFPLLFWAARKKDESS